MDTMLEYGGVYRNRKRPLGSRAKSRKRQEAIAHDLRTTNLSQIEIGQKYGVASQYVSIIGKRFGITRNRAPRRTLPLGFDGKPFRIETTNGTAECVRIAPGKYLIADSVIVRSVVQRHWVIDGQPGYFPTLYYAIESVMEDL